MYIKPNKDLRKYIIITQKQIISTRRKAFWWETLKIKARNNGIVDTLNWVQRRI